MDSCLVVPVLLKGAWVGESSRLSAFIKSSYYDELCTAYDQLRLDRLYRSHVHGQGHIERVMLLSALIAWHEKLSPYNTRLLLLCASYHDIGRVNDAVDPGHGARSAKMLQDIDFAMQTAFVKPGQLPIVCAAIAAHSLPGSRRLETGRGYGVRDEDMARYELIAVCLKDADNLDRVRIHDLDPNRLRRSCSVKLVKHAQRIYEEYRKIQ